MRVRVPAAGRAGHGAGPATRVGDGCHAARRSGDGTRRGARPGDGPPLGGAGTRPDPTGAHAGAPDARRAHAAAPPAAPVAAVAVPGEAEAAYAAGDFDRAAALAQAASAAGDDREALWLVLVRALANRGRLADAGRACATALDRHPLSAALLTLHATLLLRDGRATDAAAAARRSLYLDRRAPVTHLVLGDALARTGDVGGAVRAFANAEALLDALPPDAPVADADGESAHRLAELARFRARTLGAGPDR